LVGKSPVSAGVWQGCQIFKKKAGGLTAPVFLCLIVSKISVYLHKAALYLINYAGIANSNSFTSGLSLRIGILFPKNPV
jgi:hypothetical protein